LQTAGLQKPTYFQTRYPQGAQPLDELLQSLSCPPAEVTNVKFIS